MKHLTAVPQVMACVVFTTLIAVCLANSAEASLIAHYEAEGNANDSAGSHHGSLVNGAGFGAGQFGQAFDLNGSNQYVSAPDSPDWDLGTADFTISAWANFDSIRSGNQGSLPNVFVAQDEGGGSQDKWIFFYDGNGNLAFHINGSNFAFLSAPSSFFPTVGDWNMFTLTRSGTALSFYANGASLGTVNTALPLSIPNATAPLTIGQAEGLGYLNGRIDDVRIYNNALTQPEVAALMNPPASAVPEPASLTLVAMGIIGLITTGIRRRHRS